MTLEAIGQFSQFQANQYQPVLNTSEIIQEKDRIEKQALEEIQLPLSDDEIEETARQICLRLATGMFSILECCVQFGTSYATFISWTYRYPHLSTMLEEAMAYYKLANYHKQLSLVDRKIEECLSVGYNLTETIEYEKILLPSKLGHEFVPKSKKEIKKHISLTDAIKLKAMLEKIEMSEVEDSEEFKDMTDNEMLRYVKKEFSKISKSGNSD